MAGCSCYYCCSFLWLPLVGYQLGFCQRMQLCNWLVETYDCNEPVHEVLGCGGKKKKKKKTPQIVVILAWAEVILGLRCNCPVHCLWGTWPDALHGFKLMTTMFTLPTLVAYSIQTACCLQQIPVPFEYSILPQFLSNIPFCHGGRGLLEHVLHTLLHLHLPASLTWATEHWVSCWHCLLGVRNLCCTKRTDPHPDSLAVAQQGLILEAECMEMWADAAGNVCEQKTYNLVHAESNTLGMYQDVARRMFGG